MGGSGSRASLPGNKSVIITDADASRPPAVAFSKQVLDFNAEGGCPINTPVFDEVDITNTLTKKIRFKFDPVHPPTCELQFSPTSGTLDKKKTKKVKIKLVIKERVNLNFKITLRIQGGESYFINLRVAGESGVFGVDPMTLEQVDDSEYPKCWRR